MHINELITTLSKTSLIQKTNIVYFLSLIDSVSYGKGEGRRKRGYRDINMVKIQNRLKKILSLWKLQLYMSNYFHLFPSFWEFHRRVTAFTSLPLLSPPTPPVLPITLKSIIYEIIVIAYVYVSMRLYKYSLLNPLSVALPMCMWLGWSLRIAYHQEICPWRRQIPCL